MPFKQCPQCSEWTYCASPIPYWECPNCESDISDVPAQDDPPPEAIASFHSVRPEDLREDLFVSFRSRRRRRRRDADSLF